MNTKVIIGVIVLLAVVAAAYYFFVLQKTVSQTQQVAPMEKGQGLGSELYGNPGGVVPETNPFQNVQANPLGGTNPFEGGYKNPFGE